MRDKPHTPDALIARIAGRQHGVIAIEQLLAIGLTRQAIARRVAAGRLFPIHRGVYAVGHSTLTHHARWKAATLALGPKAVLSHRSAAELWKLLPQSDRHAEVTLPYPASPAKRANLIIHRSRTLGRTRTTSQDGIPVTMPARTLAAASRRRRARLGVGPGAWPRRGWVKVVWAQDRRTRASERLRTLWRRGTFIRGDFIATEHCVGL